MNLYLSGRDGARSLPGEGCAATHKTGPAGERESAMADKILDTRREFLKLGIAATAGSTLLGPQAAWAQAASAAGRLRVGLTPPANQVTMGYQGQTNDTGPLQPMFEYLVMSDRATGELKPGLATSWERSTDGKTWRFKLRPDIPFHDGTRFAARDVAFSWQLITAQDARATAAGLWRQLVKTVDDIQIVNDQEVVFNLSRPEAELAYYLSQAQGFMIYSKAYWDKVGAAGYAKAPVGTGPFRFREFKPGEYILYERVENHWRQTPEFRELQLMYMPEDATRLAALLAGEIQIAEIPRAIQNQALARGMKIETSTRPAALIFSAFGGNTLGAEKGDAKAPLTNKLVRQAMNLAINRQELNEQMFGGRGEIEVVQGYQRDDPAFNPAWKPYPYDPQRAKALLAQAGYLNGFEFEMLVVSPPGFSELPSVLEAIAIYFKEIGLRPKLVQTDVAGLINRQRGMTLQNALASNRQAAEPSFSYVPAKYSSKGVNHYYEDPFIEQRLARFAQSVDSAERLQILKEIGNLLYDEYATLPLLYLYGEVAIDPRVVAEYKADIGAFGASVGHEFTKAAKK